MESKKEMNVGTMQLKVETNLDEIEQQLHRLVTLAGEFNNKLYGIDLAHGKDRTVIRCPVCIHPIEVTSREPAHEKSTLIAYCERCDANTEITI